MRLLTAMVTFLRTADRGSGRRALPHPPRDPGKVPHALRATFLCQLVAAVRRIFGAKATANDILTAIETGVRANPKADDHEMGKDHRRVAQGCPGSVAPDPGADVSKALSLHHDSAASKAVMTGPGSPLRLFSLPPEGLRKLAQRAREAADNPRNGLLATDRQLLRRNAYNLERIADHKERRYARQNRHPEHPTLQ